jgi:uncharacterized repeat protein (TIGR01451 family)/LPXTG-motif cell wall-anchored protein
MESSMSVARIRAERRELRRRVAVRRVRAMASAVVVTALALLGLNTAPAMAVGVGTIAKTLDAVQGAGFTAPNTFQTGGLVRYNLAISCSSNTTDCGIGTITDVLDPDLEYVGIVQPTQTAPIIPVSASASGQTVTIIVGSSAVPWPDGNKLNIVLVARVRPTASGIIPNQASLTTNGGTSQSLPVEIQTPPATPQWSLTKTANPTSIAPGETVTYTLRFKEPSQLGNLDIVGGTLVDTFPAGATVENADGGVVSGNTITWTVPAVPSATQVACSSSGCLSYYTKTIVLRYPASAFSGGQSPVNNALANVTYSDGSTGALPASAQITIVAPVIKPAVYKAGKSVIMPGESQLWWIQGLNYSNTTVTNWTVTDVLPSGYTNFQINNYYGTTYMPVTGVPTRVTFEYQDASGWHTLLVWNPGDPKITGLAIPAGATAIRARADSLSPGGYIYFNITAVASIDDQVGSSSQNCVTMTGDNITTPPSTCATTTIVAPYPSLGIYKHTNYYDTTSTSIRPGDSVRFTVGIKKIAGQNLTSADITDLLPSEFTYVPGSACGSDKIIASATPDSTWWPTVGSAYYGGCPALADPVISPATPTSATTLLQWLDLPMSARVADGSYYYVVAFDAIANPGTSIDNYVNEAFTNTTVPNVDTRCNLDYFITQVSDTNDINSVSGTADQMCRNTSDVQVREAAIASAYKWVKGDVGTNVFESTGTTTPGATDTVTACPDEFDGYTRYPCVAEVNPSGTFDYKFDIVNQGNLPLTNYTLYDVLPHIGDVGVNQVLATSGRLTEWTPVLSGPVVPENVPAGANATVLYNLSYDPCRPEMSAPAPGVNWQGAACDSPMGGTNVQNTWYTQAQIEAMAGSWANVKSFKVTMYPGVTVAADGWQPGVHYYFDVPMSAPQSAPASSIPGVNVGGLDLSVAWNSLGDQVSAINPATGEILPQLAAAPRKVGIIVPAKPQVQVGDYVWKDLNGDGIQTTGEPGIPGVVLQIVDESGNPVTDVFGNPVGTVTTDANGYYLFPNLPPGHTYTVAIDTTAPSTVAALAGLVPTTPQAAGSTTANDSSTGSATSTPLTSDGQKDLTLDFGFVVQPVSIGDYVWLDTNRDGLQGDPAVEPGVDGVTVVLKDASGATVGTETTHDGGYYWFTNLAPGAAYTLTFTSPTGYSWTTQNVGGVVDNNLTTDTTDSDVNPADGTIAFTAPSTGTNGSGAPDQTDNPTLDGGLVQVNLQLAKAGGTWSGLLVPGTEVTWTLSPKNAGSTAALAGWSVTEVLPAGLDLVSMSGTGYDCLATPGTCVAAGPLAAGATGETITVVTKVNASFTGSTLKNVAYVSPSTADVTETVPLVVPATVTDTTTAVTDNDAEASIHAVSVGDYVWVDADRDGVQDAGEAPVQGATVTLYAADGTTVLATTTTDATGHYWFTGLAPSTAYSIGFDVSSVSVAGTTYPSAVYTTPNAGSVTSNSATADVTDSDAVPASPTAQTATVAFTSQATGNNAGGANVADNPGVDAGIVVYNLRLTKTLTTQAPFVPGQTVTYTLQPHNDGPAAALAGWSVTDILPADLTLVTMTGTGYDCLTTPGTCVAGSMLAGGADGEPIYVTARLSASFSGSAKNVAYVAPKSGDGTETIPLVIPTLGTDTTQLDTDNDAEATLEVKKVSIGDYVWWDVNRDGLQGDPTVEPVIAGMTVNLYAADGSFVRSATTDADGYYSFTDLLPGTAYTVEFVKSSLPDTAAASFTTQDSGGVTGNDPAADVTDSDVDPATGKVTFTTPVSGANLATVAGGTLADNPGIDAGLVTFNLALDKVLDTAAPYYPGLTVTYTLTPRNDGPADALAGWSVTDLVPTGMTFVSMDADDSYDCVANVCTSKVALPAGQPGAPVTVTATIDAGFIGTANNVAYVSPSGNDVPETNPLVVPTKDQDITNPVTPTDNDAQAPLQVVPVSIGDYVWWDVNRDGLQGAPADEPVIAGMTVNLYAADGSTLVDSTTTDADGYYSFQGLAPHTAYVVEFVKSSLPDTAAASFTTQDSGGVTGNDPALDVTDSDANPADGTAAVTTPDSGANLATNPAAGTWADNPGIDAGLVTFNLALDKVLDTAAPYYPGLTVTYTLTPRNDGPADALAGWSVTDLVPTGMTFVSMDADDSYDCVANVCTSKVALPAGQPGAPVTVTATIDAGFIGTANNVAYVSPSGNDVPETNPLVVPVKDQDISDPETLTDNDAQASLKVVPVSIGDYVWYDRNRDGQQGDPADEPVVEDGMVVNLYAADGTTLVDTATTVGGYYSFTDLAPHTAYVVEFVKPADTVFTTPLTGAAETDSDADVTTGRVSVVTKDSGSNIGTPGDADDPTIDAGLVELVSVGDYVWYDRNRDGLQGDVADEPVVPGVTVNLLDADGNPAVLPGGAPVTTTTDENGFYAFTNLLAGVAYQVQIVKPADTMFTTEDVTHDTSNAVTSDIADSDVDTTSGIVSFVAPITGDNLGTPGDLDNPTLDAGLVELVSVGDYVWWDTNRDGLQSEGELPVGGVVVNLYDATGAQVGSTTTDPVTGFYSFNNLIGGEAYTIEFVQPDNTVFTWQNEGEDSAVDSDADPLTGRVDIVAPLTGANSLSEPDDPTWDAGFIKLVSVGDYVWVDVNRDGLQSEGEPAVEGVVVNLYDADGVLWDTTTTDADGFYSFTDLLAGADYVIEFVKPDGTSFTTALTGDDSAVDSDADVVTGKVAFTAPADGANSATEPDDPTIDAGIVQFNLTLAKVLNGSVSVTVGSEVTFTLTPHNEGPVDALAGWSVTEVVPAGMTLVSMSGTGYTCTGATCVAGAALAAGADGNPITVTVTVTSVGSARNVAYVDKAPTDVPETNPLGPPPGPGTDTSTTTTDNDADASLVVTAQALAHTGTDAAPIVGLGIGLLLVGGLLLVVTRRRNRRTAHH